MPHNDLPSGIKSHAIRLREGINSGTIKKLYIWYVHNCTESFNVQEELNAVKITLQNALKTNYSSTDLSYFINEVGSSTLTEWYEETQSPIAVNEEFSFKCHDGFYVTSEKWNAFVTAIPAKYLFNAYKKHNIKLFSANIRDYLGARVSQSNINNGIVRTISENPENFWVFNNGLTVLTHETEFLKRQRKSIIKGIAIVNGAQTTGAIGSISIEPDPQALVPVRFVAVNDGNRDLIHDIVRACYELFRGKGELWVKFKDVS